MPKLDRESHKKILSALQNWGEGKRFTASPEPRPEAQRIDTAIFGVDHLISQDMCDAPEADQEAPVLIVQPESVFGDVIIDELASMQSGGRRWRHFEFAVAWVNSAGVERLIQPARDFLADGGCIRATVGLDFSSTSYEGLGQLLKLEANGSNITTHVFFDENPSCTFHPKVYLFSNTENARLFVGSNNMTGAGFGTNIEASLGITAPVADETIQAVRQALEEWRSTDTEDRTKRLTTQLLDELLKHGYVRTEEQIREQRSTEARYRPSPRTPIFGRSMSHPRTPARVTRSLGPTEGHPAISASAEVLLMRIRPRRNGRQVQISMRVLEGSFIHGAEEVVTIDGTRREIGYNEARGVRNTARFEAPEMESMTKPVARFRWVESGNATGATGRYLQFELYDAATHPVGAEILRRLEEGIADPPDTNLAHLSREATVLSASQRDQAQWYRLDSI